MPNNPFGDEPASKPRSNPFGDDGDMNDPIGRIEHAARKIRRLRSQMGADGLTPSAARELIDELTSALDAAARALRDRSS
jgi:flagellin-like hook-associated protein FlgL